MRIVRNFLFCISLLVCGSAENIFAKDLLVAVASNFSKPFKLLVEDYEAQHSFSVKMVTGSTGKLYAQILNGAPYDLFLAADTERPDRLEQKGYVEKGQRITYALGRLVLWSDKNSLPVDGFKLLKTVSFRHLAMANPKTAPYGRAAKEVLVNTELWGKWSSQIVFGENINQTFQFVKTQNADWGFIALSQIKDHGLDGKDAGWLVPEGLYEPIVQDAVLLKRAGKNSKAREFLRFLASSEARARIRSLGYGTE